MSEMKHCACGSPMSLYEQEHYGKCTGCHKTESEATAEQKKQERLRAEQEQKERIKKVRLEAVEVINKELALLDGKQIQSARVQYWTEMPIGSSGTLDVQATSVKIICTDGTTAEFSLESQGCCGSYDHYQGVDVCVPTPKEGSN